MKTISTKKWPWKVTFGKRISTKPSSSNR